MSQGVSPNRNDRNAYSSVPGSRKPSTAAAGGMNRTMRYSTNQPVNSEVVTAPPKPQMVEFKARGRRISVAECKFVFSKVWKTTCKHQHKETDGEGHHPHGVKSPHEILLTDLFHIVDYSSFLLNKECPGDDATTPFDEFMKYARTEKMAENEGGQQMEITYVDACDVPKMLFGIFVG